MQSVKLSRYIEWIDGGLLFAALLLLTYGLEKYGLFEPHEGHFAGVAREMILRGNWVTPTLNGAPYLNKPPLLYWSIATSFKLFGFHEFAARIPIALAGWLGVVVAWWWSRQIWGVVASRATVILLSTSVGWFIFAHQLLIDELLGTLLLGMMYCLWRLTVQPKSHIFFVAAYLLLGLAVLAKGILALAFWAAGCGAIALTYRRWQTVGLFRPLLGICISAATVAPWCVAVERDNPGFLQYFLLNENFKRVLDTRWPPDYSISKISPWGYVAVSALWCLPWVFVLPPALQSLYHAWRRGLSSQSPSNDRQRSDALTLLGVLAALPILMFLPLSSRLYYYSIPALPPLAMAAGHWWSTAWHGKSERARVWIGWVMVGLGVAIATGLIWLPQRVIGFFPELAQTQGVQTIVTVQLIGLGVGFVGSGIFLLREQLAIALVLLWFGFGTTWATVIQGFKTVQDFRSSKTLVLQAKDRLQDAPLWIFEGSRELGVAGSMSFYLNPSGFSGFKGTKSADSILAAPKMSAVRSTRAIGLSDGRSLQTPTRPDGAISADWVVTPIGILYQTVAVLTDAGSNRLPPSFPGEPPPTLITKAQMQQFWSSDRPVVFVTDFLRRPDDPRDPPTLNLPKDAGEPLLEIGPRKLYGNASARKLWLK
ncbi:ArnT family glycosyltransferase [Altericista sp. CCNU0014]|uniref:ArnT family glycosyltransferase n=1 Tax=Altericista sp. CCNU0014 TaxID=3082949 RepID=UPI00384A69BE